MWVSGNSIGQAAESLDRPTPFARPVRPANRGLSSKAPVTLAECRASDSTFNLRVEEVATHSLVEPRALAVRTLLHLPRLAVHRGRVTWRQIDSEIRRCAAELRVDQAKVERLVPHDKFELQALDFVPNFNSGDAGDIFNHLHYLRSARGHSLNYALVDRIHRKPVSLCSVSRFEWKRVGRQITSQFDVPISAVWDISRVYSFDVAPVNAISFLLAKVRNDIRQRFPDAQLLTTAVDQNLGFTGSSYRAANWRRWMTIKARPYLYYDENYVTPRQLQLRFQTTNVDELRAQHGDRFQQSRAVLLDSMIFCCRVKGETEVVPETEQRRLRR